MHISSFHDIKERRRRRRFIDAMHKKLEHKERLERTYNHDTDDFDPV